MRSPARDGHGAAVDERNPVAEARVLPAILQELGISLVRIESGRFQMGSADRSRFGRFSQCEGPQHTVVISNDLLVERVTVPVTMSILSPEYTPQMEWFWSNSDALKTRQW